MKQFGRVWAAIAVGALAGSYSHAGQSDLKSTIQNRISQAQLIVYGRVKSVNSRLDVNERGDRLIYSRAEVEVRDVYKGAHPGGVISVDYEGGTINAGTPQQLTLSVSSLTEPPRAGEEAVLLLHPGKAADVYELKMKGKGLLRPDPSTGKLKGSTLSLDDVKGLALGSK